MANDLATTKKTPQAFIKDMNVQKMITERLGKRSGQFTTSLLSLVNANKNIAECTPLTIVQAALTAASLDLPINQNLGFAYIVPYKNHGTAEAQFQMGWKGFIQLAQRSGQFKTINATDVREGEITGRDRMTGELKFQWQEEDEIRNQLPVVGYLAYFELLNGFQKSLYMTKSEIEAHATRYSQAYRSSSKGQSKFKTPWETDFDLMAQKTALKQLLSKYAPLSTEMQEAIVSDQSTGDGKYADNPDLSDVGADDEKKQAIVDANTPEAEVVEPTEETSDEDLEANMESTLEEDAKPTQEELTEKAKARYAGKNTSSPARKR